jgi:hypothetical protein
VVLANNRKMKTAKRFVDNNVSVQVRVSTWWHKILSADAKKRHTSIKSVLEDVLVEYYPYEKYQKLLK